MKSLGVFIVFILLFFNAKSQYKYNIGIEFGGDFNSKTYPLALDNRYVQNNIFYEDRIIDKKDQGVSLFLNNEISIKSFLISLGLGISYMPHWRSYKINLGRDTTLSFATYNKNMYWRYRFSLAYQFVFKSKNKLVLGIGVSGQDFALDREGAPNRTLYYEIPSSEDENIYDVRVSNLGRTIFTPYLRIGIVLPLFKNEIAINYRFYYDQFLKYNSSIGVSNDQGFFKEVNALKIGYNNHSFSISYNFKIFDDGLEEKRQEMKRKKKASK